MKLSNLLLFAGAVAGSYLVTKKSPKPSQMKS